MDAAPTVTALPASPRLDVEERHFHAVPGSSPVEWLIWPGLSGYDSAVAFMEARVAGIAAGTARRRCC